MISSSSYCHGGRAPASSICLGCGFVSFGDAIHIFVTWKSTDNSYKFYRIYNDVYQRAASLRRANNTVSLFDTILNSLY